MPTYVTYIIYSIYLCLQIFPVHIYAVTELGPERIIKNTTFTKIKSPYVIRNTISVQEGVTLTIEDGATLIFDGGGFFLHEASFVGKDFTMNIQDNSSNTSFVISGDRAHIDISNVYLSNTSRSFISVWNDSYVDISNLHIQSFNTYNVDRVGLQVFNNSSVVIKNSSFSGFTKGLDIFSSSYATITDSVYSDNDTGIYTFDSYLYVRNNDFVHNTVAIEFFIANNNTSVVDARHNWWGSVSKPKTYTFQSEMYQTDVNVLLGPIDYDPWSLQPYKKVTGAVSNVLFLPGLMGSRLYQKGKTENQLWEPNRNRDVKKLFLDQSGNSIEQDVYTRDVLAKTNITGGVTPLEQTPYKDFFAYMDQLVKSKIIESWKPAPYDWRYSPDTILEQGIVVGTSKGDIFTTNLVAEVLLLAKTSKTKKVTIVTHSNGGLVGKQLMIDLQRRKLDQYIDKIIFVAMPEYGTPQAITSLLYGHEQSIAGGLILSTSVAQQLGVNMPTAYTLLPSQKYFATGKTITLTNEMFQSKNLLNVSLNTRGVVNNTILHKADIFHQQVDSWIPPQHVDVFQIVGTGLLTVSGLMENSAKEPLPTYTSSGDGVVQDMYIQDSLTYNRTGKVFAVDLSKSKNTHMDIMNNTENMKYLDNLMRKVSVSEHVVYPQHANDYTLLYINSAFASSSKMSDKKVSVLHPTLRKDTLSFLSSTQFHNTQTISPTSRYDVFNTNLQYITQKDIGSVDVREMVGDTIDIHIFKKTENTSTESVYEHVKVFSGSGFSLNKGEQSVHILLPDIENAIRIPITKEVVYNNTNNIVTETYTATSTETLTEKIVRIKNSITSSNVTSYVKTRYLTRLDAILKKGKIDDLTLLRKKAEQSVRSINSFATSPALKGRYSKLRQDYIYLSYVID